MKQRVLKISLLAVVFLMASATALFADGNNARKGAVNAFAKYYGQVIPSSLRSAQDALLYIDFENEDGKIPEALVNLGYTVTVATDWDDFSDKLNNGNYGLAVGFNQNLHWESWKPGLISALTTYIAGGGSVVFNDWTSDNDFAVLFQTSFTSNTNQTEMTLDSSIEENVPNPITLANTDWAVFSTGLEATGDGEVLATFANGDDAIVRGNSGRTIILGYLTDTPPVDNRQQLFENLFQAVAPVVPTSSIAINVTMVPNVTYDSGTQSAQDAINDAREEDEIEVYYNPIDVLLINKKLHIHYIFNSPM